jgi:hypothetical protein
MSRNTPRQSQGQGGSGVSILGAGSKSIVVRVSNLAQGTTAEDVVVSFTLRFYHLSKYRLGLKADIYI